MQGDGPKPDLPDRVLQVVLNIHRMLDEKGIRAVFFRSPFPSTTNRIVEVEAPGMGLNVQGAYASLVESLRSQNIQVFDFSNHPLLSSELGLYSNSTHVNRSGAEVFSLLLREAMGEDKAEAPSSAQESGSGF